MTFVLPIRQNIASLEPYSSARSVLKGGAWTFLDANEGAFPATVQLTDLPPLNRYPDPTSDALRDAIAGFYNVARENLFIGCGSDEIIDLCTRAFVRSGHSVAAMRPSYGVYRVSAEINDVPFVPIPLENDFRLDPEKMLRAADGCDVLFLCSPNNPSGLVIERPVIDQIVKGFKGIVVMDEAYGEFADAVDIPSSIDLVRSGAPNLLVMRTFSKAFGAAAIRVGYGIASPQIIEVLLKMKPPYNLNALSQAAALSLWNDRPTMLRRVKTILTERASLMRSFASLGFTVYPSMANFFLVKPQRIHQADVLYRELIDRSRIVTRRFPGAPALENMLRITVGTSDENLRLLNSISSLLI